MRQLNLPPLFWNVSHLKIFPLQLLGPAIGFLAGPSSCKGKILRWDTTTNPLSTSKCLILDVVLPDSSLLLLHTHHSEAFSAQKWRKIKKLPAAFYDKSFIILTLFSAANIGYYIRNLKLSSKMGESPFSDFERQLDFYHWFFFFFHVFFWYAYLKK